MIRIISSVMARSDDAALQAVRLRLQVQVCRAFGSIGNGIDQTRAIDHQIDPEWLANAVALMRS